MTEEEKTDAATVLAAASGALRAGRTDGETDTVSEMVCGSRATTGTNCSMKRSNENWPVCTG